MVCIFVISELQRLKTPALKITLIYLLITSHPRHPPQLTWMPLSPAFFYYWHISLLYNTRAQLRPDSGRGDLLQQLPSSTAAQDRARLGGEHSWLPNQHSYTPQPFPVSFSPLSATIAQLYRSSHSFVPVIGATPTALE